MDYATWIRRNGFILGLILAVVLAFIFPEPGSRGGFLHPDLINNPGIALILFLQGLSLAFEKLKNGGSNWKLHVIIQSFTFVIFPLVGIVFYLGIPLLWKSETFAIRQGLLYLCVLPFTISTSAVLTAVAHGNVAGALFNADQLKFQRGRLLCKAICVGMLQLLTILKWCTHQELNLKPADP